MKIVCSWCRKEGIAEFVGEKAPLDDARETHGICINHRHQVQVHWQESSCAESGAGSDQGLGMSNLLFRWSGLLKVTRKIDL
jgi:hypothetical protein